jgi:hypothetical protein
MLNRHPRHDIKEAASVGGLFHVYASGRREYSFSFPRHDLPEVCHLVVPLLRRAQGKPGADCARSPVCEKCAREAHGLTTGTTRTSRLSPRNGFNGFLRAPRGSGLSCHRRQRDTSRQRSARVAAPGPHDFAVRCRRFRPRDLHRADAGCVHRIPCPTFRDDREASLRRAQGSRNILPICGNVKRIF